MMTIASTITDAELIRLSCQNPELRFERDAEGMLVTMSPIGSISANREVKAITRLAIWVEARDLGEVFSSSGGFKLPNNAIRSPDVAFVAKERLPEGWEEREDEFLNLAPDFVIEIGSKTDSLTKLKQKMKEYQENGVKLGWLIDRQNKQAFVYRQDGTITCYPANAILGGEDVVPGFTLVLEILF